MIVIALIFIVGVALLLLNGERIKQRYQFRKKVTELFADAPAFSQKTFHYDQLNTLPQPVQRYFRHVLQQGQPYISYVRLQHEGKFKSDLKKEWAPITGEQYFTASKPGFIWKGKTKLFTACDQYSTNKGRLTVSLFSIFPVVDGSGSTYDQGELLRWLGESVWFPTNLLPSDALYWLPVDDTTAELHFNYKPFQLTYSVTFNKTGEIVQLETKRYLNEKNIETWIGRLYDYKKVNNVVIPARIEAIWKLKETEYPYARFQVKEIQYNIPEPY